MLNLKIIVAALLLINFYTFTQQKTKKPESRSPVEVSVDIGYSHPMLEAYGTNITINSTEDQIYIDGKRMLVSDNFGTENGYSAQVQLKYKFKKKGFVKG